MKKTTIKAIKKTSRELSISINTSTKVVKDKRRKIIKVTKKDTPDELSTE